MNNFDIAALLRENAYPGRGILLGRSQDGAKAVMAYFIMGRSENSRNRIFEVTDDGIRTRAFDESKMTDPSLIIYHPIRKVGRGYIVTNGDQTDTIREYLEKGLPMEQALRTRCFEPDGPNWTPRISGLLSPDGSYKLSILKSADAEGTGCLRQTFEYPGQAGVAHFLHPSPPLPGSRNRWPARPPRRRNWQSCSGRISTQTIRFPCLCAMWTLPQARPTMYSITNIPNKEGLS